MIVIVTIHFHDYIHVRTAKMIAEDQAKEVGLGPVFFSENKDFYVEAEDDLAVFVVTHMLLKIDTVRAVTIAKKL